MVDRIPDSPTTHQVVAEAAAGSSAALLTLAELAIAAGDAGETRGVEALTAAETCARLAAARGGVEEQRALVHLLLTRADFEVRSGATGLAAWYEADARRVLALMSAAGDEEATGALAELGLVNTPPTEGPSAYEMAALAAAAGGDLAALNLLLDHSLNLLWAGSASPFEALAVAEVYARLAAASGHSEQMRRLAGVLMLRASLEYREGRIATGDHNASEAIVLLSIIVDGSDPGAAPWLAVAISESTPSAFAFAARFNPKLLNFVTPVGSC